MNGTWDSSSDEKISHSYRERGGSVSAELHGYIYVGHNQDAQYLTLKRHYGPWRVVTKASQMGWPPPRAIIFGPKWKLLKESGRIHGIAIRLSGLYGTELSQG